MFVQGHDLEKKERDYMWIIGGFWEHKLKSDRQYNERRIGC